MAVVRKDQPSREPFGTLTDYRTGNPIRPATSAQWLRTAEVINSRRPDAHAGAFLDGDGRSVWVDGGPDAAVSGADLAALREEARIAGDEHMLETCTAALNGDDICLFVAVMVILNARLEALDA